MNLLMYGDSNRSMDMFHALGVAIIDPFLYGELDGRRFAVIGHNDHELIRAHAPQVEVLDPLRYGRLELVEQGMDWTEAQLEVSRRACRELGMTAATVNWDFPVALTDLLRSDGVELDVDHRAFEARRRVKTAAQVDGIRRAQKAADAAMAEAARLLRECPQGLSSEAVRRAMQRVCDDRGCDLGEDVIVAVNAQSADGHERGHGPIVAGDTVLIDIWPRDRATRCWADMTRTFVAAGRPPSDELALYWRLAREALDAALAQVRPGAHGRDIHLLASKVFEDAGQPTLNTLSKGAPMPASGFLHGLGHGVGLEVHEAPGLGLSGDELVAGDVVTVEPGCYRQEFGGVRLEDLVLVTEGGCENLTDFPYGLEP